ncbi:DB domain-containing protein [Meloidogyne graminicola]|uniref:DB domain-containing protein n=1 Tax=Meloidogyne graminicola TaxID=189291 RepID=A0A8S9ZTS2_9BILA|nr:DB domain-containing protein [Meloidogyne graminicola]
MPAPVTCNVQSCQPGYTCGHYGCARNRARSALTKKDGLIVSVDEYVNQTLKNPKKTVFDLVKEKKYLKENKQEEYELDKITFLRLTNPNFLFRQCCEDRKLPDSCLHKCHFNTYTKETLQQMFFKRDPCPIEAASDIQYCAAQGRDHKNVVLKQELLQL